jgi:DNA-binding CsgD family transcriptional regulator
MDKVVSQFSLEFRDLIVKVIKEDFFLNKSPKYDKVFLAEKYKSIVDHINGFILIANYQSGLYEYVSDGIFPHLGYDIRPYKTNESLTDFIISIIKPEHRDFLVNNLLPTVLKYFKEHSTQATGTDFRYTCCMRLKNIYDVYHWYLVDTVLIEVDETGFPVRTLVTATNISQFKKDELVYYNILKKNQDGVYEVMLEGTADNNISELQLTPRELQIINLISQGLTNKEIASKLFISLNTVQTHRKSIMRKTKCSGTAELTNFAFTRGLL